MPYGKKTVGTIAYMGGVPAVLEAFAWAWGQLIQYNADYLVDPGESIFYTRSLVSYHSAARNAVVDQMRGDWLLMLDADHAFQPDLAARLLTQMERHDVDVLTGLYVYRSAPHNPVVFTRTGDRIEYLGDWDRDAAIFEVGAAGAGCLMIRRRVFDRIRDELHENPFEIRKSFSEDNSFFDRCWELGIKCYCCPTIESPHLAVRPVTLADYRPDPALIGPRVEVEGRV
jgi:glycosyltransferase involved in cell wall biosynthesis